MKICVEVLKILLKDKTTGRNIFWATDDYENISECEEIQVGQINLIQPRFKKFRKQQKIRQRSKAEIFTPTWICNEQNNLIDEAWFGRPNVFNKIIDSQSHIWQKTSEKIYFEGERTWQNYVEANRLEISCGEVKCPNLSNNF